MTGSRSQQFKVGKQMASLVYNSEGQIPVLGANRRLNVMGAATAMAHASNAYDIDDGHNLIRAHPGTSFIGGLLAVAYHKNVTYEEFLTTLAVTYEATIRFGRAVMDYYQFAHSSGTFGAFGTAAGTGRLFGLSREMLNNALSVADFNAPLAPGIRSVKYPSMNKDGVPFGVMIGMLAVAETLCGFSGNKHLLEAEPYAKYLDDLGVNYEILQLYFKPYPCCRWAHAAIDACLDVMREWNITHNAVERVIVYTFERATLLSKIIPKTTDEAQYNIAYPVAAAIVAGDFGFAQVFEDNLNDPHVLQVMDKLEFRVDPYFDSEFPQKRFCRVEMYLKNGKMLRSSVHEPRGEAHENIGTDWIIDKFKRITEPILTRSGQEIFIACLHQNLNQSMRQLMNLLNQKEYWRGKTY